MKTFIIPGARVHLSRISDYLNDDVCGILVHERIDAGNLTLSGPNAGEIGKRVYTLNSLLKPTVDRLDARDKLLCDGCLSYILSDPRVHYLATRSNWNSAFNNSIMIEKILVNSISVIAKTNPSRLIASSTPHSLEAWIFAKCFEYLKLPVYILERTPIFSRAWIYCGLDRQDVVPLGRGDAKNQLPESYMALIREQRTSRAGARDKNGFYASRFGLSSIRGANTNDWWSYRREATFLSDGKIMSLPIRLASFHLKRVLYKSYTHLATSELPDNPFVIYFMHYQPERSSLPEGLAYAQQWIAIRQLSWSLPKGWTLLVREHPTTWYKPLDISVRARDLYKDISALQNTKICSMDLDTFELIDKSEAVATLTGHVGFQAILRNKPAIAFGLPQYKDHPACFSVKSLKDICEALNVIQDGRLSSHFTDEALHKYLAWVQENSICADPDEQDWREVRLKSFTEIYRQVFCGYLELPDVC